MAGELTAMWSYVLPCRPMFCNGRLMLCFAVLVLTILSNAHIHHITPTLQGTLQSNINYALASPLVRRWPSAVTGSGSSMRV